MSQHPIDDLFANQLRDHGVKPVRASWEELQHRMNAKEERKSPFVWGYASAASVAVLLLVSWWLWSGGETGKPNLPANRIAQQTPEKAVQTRNATEQKTSDLKPTEASEGPVIAFEKPIDSQKPVPPTIHRQPAEPRQQPTEEPIIAEKPVTPTHLEDNQKPESLVAAVALKEPERTLIVQMATPEIQSAGLVASTGPSGSELTENNDDQPKKKRFRLGRVSRQFNKLKAGEAVEWEEVGVQPGVLLARASDKVQEGKEKISNSYENLRYNAFKKNPNNK